jgi:hypothetical protein
VSRQKSKIKNSPRALEQLSARGFRITCSPHVVRGDAGPLVQRVTEFCAEADAGGGAPGSTTTRVPTFTRP